MWKELKKLVKDCLTGIDGETYDPARVATMFALGTFFWLAAYAVMELHQTFEFQSFGVGFGAVIAGGAWAIKHKADNEPGAKE